MIDKTYQAALIGCGDYLRWEVDKLNSSKYFKVKKTFDLDQAKSKSIAQKLQAETVDSAEAIFNDKNIDIVMLFTPPWVRTDLFQQAIDAGKHIITTKPLANNLEQAQKLVDIVGDKVNCAVFYGRTGDAAVEKLKQILDSGEIGQLSLYKEDWFHHYPTWNDWATDPAKNGGPFMDAMIHNLNKSCYLIGDEVSSLTFFSENHAQDLACNDTEMMKVDFKNGASSYLFISWAADLPVFDLSGNDREHIGLCQQITNKGWWIEEGEVDGQYSIIARKEKEIKSWPVNDLELTPYDEFAVCLHQGKAQAFDLETAFRDIQLLTKGYQHKSQQVPIN